MKPTNIIMLAAAFAAVAVFAADQDLGKIITDGNIADVAGVTNAGDGTATVSIKDNTGTANSVTVYNKSTMDTALAGKASTGDVSALASRATALETATNNLTTAVAGIPSMTWDYSSITNPPWLLSSAISSWALAASKPSYNFSEIGATPTTLSGYGITDAKITNGTITLGANTITPLTAFTETDPVWLAEKSGYVATSRTVAGMALTDNITLKSLSIVGASTSTYNGSAAATVNNTTATLESTTNGGTTGKNLTVAVAATSVDFGAYYIKIGTDGKPHLMLRQ